MAFFPEMVPASFVESSAADVNVVLEWLHERGGHELAHAWLMSCTPWPCALPNAKQLEEGILVASGELSIGELMGRIEEDMAKQSALGWPDQK